ncbi:MAG: hypothetical protein ACI8P3_004188, partial [Saprospiraceae bacterium]
MLGAWLWISPEVLSPLHLSLLTPELFTFERTHQQIQTSLILWCVAFFFL